MIRVTVWNENIHEKEIPEQMAHYPRGIHGAIAEYLQKSPDELDVRIATQDQPACGLPDDVLNTTDVMIWWGHAGHHLVPDDLARRVADRVLLGMGLIVLHSGHYSKPFRLLMGTTCSLRCRDGDYERLWCVDPGHPIAKGIPMNVELPMEEMYGEFFDIPRPDGRDCFTAMKEAGVSYRAAGENIAKGQRTPEQVVDGWMKSDGHRENLLSADFGRLGVGYHVENGRTYWVQLFAD